MSEYPVKMVQRSFNHILEITGSMESEWAMFYTATVEEAAQSCSSKVTVASCDSNPRTRWWTPEVKGAINLWLWLSLRQKAWLTLPAVS